jgi:hypothetical protein
MPYTFYIQTVKPRVIDTLLFQLVANHGVAISPPAPATVGTVPFSCTIADKSPAVTLKAVYDPVAAQLTITVEDSPWWVSNATIESQLRARILTLQGAN